MGLYKTVVTQVIYSTEEPKIDICKNRIGLDDSAIEFHARTNVIDLNKEYPLGGNNPPLMIGNVYRETSPNRYINGVCIDEKYLIVTDIKSFGNLNNYMVDMCSGTSRDICHIDPRILEKFNYVTLNIGCISGDHDTILDVRTVATLPKLIHVSSDCDTFPEMEYITRLTDTQIITILENATRKDYEAHYDDCK